MFRIVLPLLLCCATTSIAHAQAVLDVHGTTARAIPIALPNVVGSAEYADAARRIHRRLARALAFHGAFEPVTAGLIDDGLPPDRFRASAWRAAGLDLLLRTRLERQGTQYLLDVFLYDVAGAETLMSRRFRGTSVDALADGAADAAIAVLLQQPGPFSQPIAIQYRPPGQKWREVYQTDWSGTMPRRRTDGLRLALQPVWLPGTDDLVVIGYPRRIPALLYIPANGAVRTLLQSQGNLHGLAVSNGHVFYARDVRGNTDLYRFDLASGKHRRLTQHPAADLSPAPAPDGQRIAFISDRLGNPYLFILDMDSGDVRPLLVDGLYIGEPAWSPDGRWIAIVHRDRQGRTRIGVVEPEQGRLSFVTGVLDDTVEGPTWGADSRTILFSRLSGDSYDIWKTDRATRIATQLTHFVGDARMPDWRLPR